MGRILSTDTAQLSQCSWSVIEKVVTAIETELRNFKERGYEKCSFGTFSFLRSSGSEIGFSM